MYYGVLFIFFHKFRLNRFYVTNPNTEFF